MKGKLTTEHAEGAEFFLVKTKNTNHSMEMEFSSPFDPPGMKKRG
jgi:hypothetical protein